MNQTYSTRNGRSKYRVRRGDSLSKISEKLYGHMDIWPLLARYNNINAPYNIQTGQVIKTPVLSPAVTLNAHGAKSRAPLNGGRPARPNNGLGLPKALPPADVCVKIPNDMLKKLLGNFLPETVTAYGNCYKAEMSVEGSLSIKRFGTDTCLQVSPDSLTIEAEAKKKLGPYLEDIRKMSLEWHPKEQKVVLKPTASMKLKTGATEVEFGMEGKLPAFLTGKGAVTTQSAVLTFYTKNKRSTEFTIGNLVYTLDLTVTVKLSPDATQCRAPNMAVYRPRRTFAVDPNMWDSPTVKILVQGTAIVAMGVLVLSGGGLVVTATAALFILLTGAVAPDTKQLRMGTI